jgi:hypothetical protein
MIGSTNLNNELTLLLNAPIEAWEDSLKANHDDYVYVDGEEGDFGLVSYYGPDAAGHTVRMMAKYVHGGDNESTYYTKEGVNHIRSVLFGNALGSIFDKALGEVLEPEDGEEDMRLGWIKAAEEAYKAIGGADNA